MQSAMCRLKVKARRKNRAGCGGMRREENNRRYANRRLSARLSYRALVSIIPHIFEFNYWNKDFAKKLL